MFVPRATVVGGRVGDIFGNMPVINFNCRLSSDSFDFLIYKPSETKTLIRISTRKGEADCSFGKYRPSDEEWTRIPV